MTHRNTIRTVRAALHLRAGTAGLFGCYGQSWRIKQASERRGDAVEVWFYDTSGDLIRHHTLARTQAIADAWDEPLWQVFPRDPLPWGPWTVTKRCAASNVEKAACAYELLVAGMSVQNTANACWMTVGQVRSVIRDREVCAKRAAPIGAGASSAFERAAQHSTLRKLKRILTVTAA
jgi:hypothetical protein